MIGKILALGMGLSQSEEKMAGEESVVEEDVYCMSSEAAGACK